MKDITNYLNLVYAEDAAPQHLEKINNAFVYDRDKAKRYLQIVEDDGGFDVCRAADPRNCRIHHTGKYAMNKLGMKLSNGVGRVKSFVTGRPYVQEARDLSKASEKDVKEHLMPLSSAELSQLQELVGYNQGKASDRIDAEQKRRDDWKKQMEWKRTYWYPKPDTSPARVTGGLVRYNPGMQYYENG